MQYFKKILRIYTYFNEVGSPHGVVAKVMNCNIPVSEFDLHSRNYVLFRTNTFRKSMNL